MKLEDIKKRVNVIEKCKSDDESAHSKEDELMKDFILFIADGDSEYSVMAKEVLKTGDIDFARWCA